MNNTLQAVKERPIIMQPESIERILAGRKTQTRRILKHPYAKDAVAIYPDGSGRGWIGWMHKDRGAEETVKTYPGNDGFKCPYGEAGSILWVRETWRLTDFLHPSDENYGYIYRASENGREWEHCDENWTWKSSIHMPKAAARIWLRLDSIRVERIQDITEDDAIAEGVEVVGKTTGFDVYNTPFDMPLYKDYTGQFDNFLHPVNSFKSLFAKINGDEMVNANPWCWVLSFSVLSTTGKPEQL